MCSICVWGTQQISLTSGCYTCWHWAWSQPRFTMSSVLLVCLEIGDWTAISSYCETHEGLTICRAKQRLILILSCFNILSVGLARVHTHDLPRSSLVLYNWANCVKCVAFLPTWKQALYSRKRYRGSKERCACIVLWIITNNPWKKE